MSELPVLRLYQQSTISLARKAFVKHKHVLLVSPVGSGKTFMFSEIARSCIGRGYKVLIVSSRTKLLKQAGGSLTKFGITAQYISASHRTIPDGNCVVATAQTIQRRYQQSEYQEFLKSVDLLIIDEAHRGEFNFLLESGLFDSKWLLGVTATPRRYAKQRQLGLDYEVMVEGLSVKAGIDLGFLMPSRLFSLDCPDLSAVSIDPIRGDYTGKDLYKVFSTNKVYGGVISEFKRICNGERTICFCSSQTHAIQTCIEFNKAGISSKFVVSGLRNTDEDYHLFEDNQHLTGKHEDIEDQFDRDEFTVLCNVGVYTEGYDSTGIINVIMLRATLHDSTWDQCVGRGSRPHPGKLFFRILDFGDNYARHGGFERQKTYSLWHDNKSGNGVVMTKLCDPAKTDKEGKKGCNRLIHVSYPTCPFCNYIFKTQEEIREIELREIIGDQFKFRDMNPQQLLAYSELNGYKKNWVFRMLWTLNTEKDFRAAMRELGYSNKFIYVLLKRFGEKKMKNE